MTGTHFRKCCILVAACWAVDRRKVSPFQGTRGHWGGKTPSYFRKKNYSDLLDELYAWLGSHCAFRISVLTSFFVALNFLVLSNLFYPPPTPKGFKLFMHFGINRENSYSLLEKFNTSSHPKEAVWWQEEYTNFDFLTILILLDYRAFLNFLITKYTWPALAITHVMVFKTGFKILFLS